MRYRSVPPPTWQTTDLAWNTHSRPRSGVNHLAKAFGSPVGHTHQRTAVVPLDVPSPAFPEAGTETSARAPALARRGWVCRKPTACRPATFWGEPVAEVMRLASTLEGCMVGDSIASLERAAISITTKSWRLGEGSRNTKAWWRRVSKPRCTHSHIHHARSSHALRGLRCKAADGRFGGGMPTVMDLRSSVIDSACRACAKGRRLVVVPHRARGRPLAPSCRRSTYERQSRRDFAGLHFRASCRA